jgi:hypothetical protein
MQIAVLGWGSLLWDESRPYEIAPRDWLFDGPKLRIEFARVSASRDGALTLVVVDEPLGAPCQVAWAPSRQETAGAARARLAGREGADEDQIGLLHVVPARDRVLLEPKATIEAWGLSKRLDAVVWTGLRSNFAERAGLRFSVEAAVEYVRSMDGAARRQAIEYVHRASRLVQTPLRTALERQRWFAEEVEALGRG